MARNSQFDDAKKMEEELQQHFVSLKFNADKVFFCDLTDLHIGHIGFDDQGFSNFVELVKNTPNFYVFIGGDATNHANKGSKSSQYEEYMTPREQIKGKFERGKLVRKGMIQLLEPIMDRIIGASDGNHNTTRLREFNDMSAIEYFCDITGIPYYGEMAWIEFLVRRNSYVHYIHHTGSTGRTGNKAKLIQRNTHFQADVQWGEHTHQDGFKREHQAYVDRYAKRIAVRDMLFVDGGTYQSWSGYAKAKGYSLLKTGGSIVEMSGKSNSWDIRVYERVIDFVEARR